MVDYKSIPMSGSDLLLNEWGYDLIEECFQLIIETDFPFNNYILDIATGTGRAASTLTRLGYSVITVDYNYDIKIRSVARITNKYLDKVTFAQLNLESIPFLDNSIDNIVCINTIHELNNPSISLNEIIRSHSGKGKMLIADFNSKGFDLMDKLHVFQYGKLHARGKTTLDDLQSILIRNYSFIKEINTKLNTGFIVSGKKYEA